MHEWHHARGIRAIRLLGEFATLIPSGHACAVTSLKRVTNLKLYSASSTSALRLMILFAERRTNSGGLWVARFLQLASGAPGSGISTIEVTSAGVLPIPTLLLDHGVPVNVVAARCGQDPATLLRSYAKRTRKADANAASVIGSIARGVLKD